MAERRSRKGKTRSGTASVAVPQMPHPLFDAAAATCGERTEGDTPVNEVFHHGWRHGQATSEGDEMRTARGLLRPALAKAVDNFTSAGRQ